MEQDDDGVTICAVYGSGSGCHRGGRSHSHDNEATVEFVAHVPAGVEFSGAMVSGDIDVVGLTETEMAARLRSILEAQYVQRASVTVQVREFRSRPISV